MAIGLDHSRENRTVTRSLAKRQPSVYWLFLRHLFIAIRRSLFVSASQHDVQQRRTAKWLGQIDDPSPCVRRAAWPSREPPTVHCDCWSRFGRFLFGRADTPIRSVITFGPGSAWFAAGATIETMRQRRTGPSQPTNEVDRDPLFYRRPGHRRDSHCNYPHPSLFDFLLFDFSSDQQLFFRWVLLCREPA